MTVTSKQQRPLTNGDFTMSNEITNRPNRRAQITTAFNNSLEARRTGGAITDQFSNKQGIDAVCQAIINCADTNLTTEQKQVSCVTAAYVAYNSKTAAQEVEEILRANNLI